MRVRWVSILGLAIAAVLIWWLFRQEDPAEVWAHIREANFALLALAVAVATAVFPIRAIRWRHFLAPAQPNSPFRSRFAAVCIGFMANNILPARVGEVARAFAYSRVEPVSATTALATLVVERFLDGVVILFLLLVALASPAFPSSDLPGELVASIRVVSLILSAVLLGALVLLASPDRTSRAISWIAGALLPERIARFAVDLTGHVVTGLASLRGWRLVVPALGWSLGVWLGQSLAFWLGFFAFGIDLPFSAALLTNAAVAFAVAAPSTPGFVGPFHAAATLSLANVYGVAGAPALGFAFGFHFGGFIPITLMGLWYAHRIGLSLGELKSRGRRQPGADKAEEPRHGETAR